MSLRAEHVESRQVEVFSDNDKLSAILAAGADADGLALLTDVEAVFTKPPGEPGAERIKTYKEADRVEIGAKSGMGRGGMAAKITAARVAARGGVATCIASGYDLDNITKVFGGLDVGTYFEPDTRPNKRQRFVGVEREREKVDPRLRWLTLATECAGKLMVGGKFREELEVMRAGGGAMLTTSVARKRSHPVRVRLGRHLRIFSCPFGHLTVSFGPLLLLSLLNTAPYSSPLTAARMRKGTSLREVSEVHMVCSAEPVAGITQKKSAEIKDALPTSAGRCFRFILFLLQLTSCQASSTTPLPACTS
eukprot:768667-Hanusia_phi.AAC.12